MCKLTERTTAFWLILFACVGVIATAWVMEHVFEIKACQLCHYERYVYVLAGTVALLGLLFKRNIFLGLTSLIFLFGACLSFYHVAIQQGWFELPSFCQTPLLDPNASLEDLRAQLLGTPMITCNVVSWSLFGISFAGYNVIASLLLSAFSFLSYGRNR